MRGRAVYLGAAGLVDELAAFNWGVEKVGELAELPDGKERR